MHTRRKLDQHSMDLLTGVGSALLLCVGVARVHAQRVASLAQEGQGPASQAVLGYDGHPEYTDPAGTYAGFTICADCSGISVRLELTNAAAANDRGTYRETMMYLDAPTHSRFGRASRDQRYMETGSWSLSPAEPGSKDRQLCLVKAPKPNNGSPACYHVVHQTVLVFINGFEADHEPDPFPAGLKTLLKQRRLSDGHEYPMLPVDDWAGFAGNAKFAATAQ